MSNHARLHDLVVQLIEWHDLRVDKKGIEVEDAIVFDKADKLDEFVEAARPLIE